MMSTYERWRNYETTQANKPNLDGCTWYWHGCCGPDFTNLEDYKLSDDPKDKGKGKIYYNDKGKGYCPICGELLVA
jgi:hypothetical protein